MQYLFKKNQNILIMFILFGLIGNCLTIIHNGYELNHNPNEVAKQVPKVKEILVYIETYTELDNYSDKDLEQPLGVSRESELFKQYNNQDYMKRAIISEIAKCRCVETVKVLFKQGDTLEEIRKENQNVISTRVRFFNNSGTTFLAHFVTSLTLFLVPTWNSNYISTEFEIYTPKSKVPEKIKFEYEETVFRHLILLPWLFTEENKIYSFYSKRIPGVYRSAVEEGYNKKLFAIEK